MARKTILDTYYTFTPSTKTIVIPRAVPRERMVLITDVTTNQVLFNFSDPNLTTTSYTISTSADGTQTTTTLVLNYNTAALNATDKLQIVIDEYDEKFSPSESYLDPINKLRVSQPQSLIDTDYEYSVQTTKWEQLALLNNMPYAYYVTATANIGLIDIQATNGTRTYVANTTGTKPPIVGTPITIIDSNFAGADGTYIVDANNNLTNANATGVANTFTYTGKYGYPAASGTIYNSGVTVGYQGATYSNSTIAIASAFVANANLVQVTTNVTHGLSVGNEIGFTGANTANGSFAVSTIVSPYVFQFNTTGTGVQVPASMINTTLTTTAALLYPRPQGFGAHRPFDGGVRFSTNSSSHNQQYVRQTRRYFRYQSGKGIQMSTGTTLKPQVSIDALQYISTNNQVVVVTKDAHNISTNVSIVISGADQSGYNGTFPIFQVKDPYTFSYVPNTTPVSATATGSYYGSINNWYGASNRIGIFDSQNGMFWEFDGQTLYAVKRSSTFQISGQVTATPGSAIITGSTGWPTIFTKQLSVGDFIVIKGMSHKITHIASDTSMTIQPPYRGIQVQTNVQISKTIDTRVPSSQFNIDRLDGTGPSGYNVDLTKMQMLYIDYSWYGAGFIRFGMRGPDGNVVYCHKIINNNVNYLAYMRSGNLPGRYETNTFSKTTFMVGGAGGFGTNFTSTDTILTANSTIGFPNTGGTLLLKNSANVIEYISYSSISGNTFIGLTRGQAGANTIANTVAGNNYLTGLVTTTGIQVGQYVYGANIPSQIYVTSVVASNNTVVLNQAPITTQSNTVVVFAPLANVAQTFSYSATAQTSIELHAPQVGLAVNHWGTSAIMDGGFTNDKSFIFTKGMTSSINVSPAIAQAVMSYRIAPSASNGFPAPAPGIREVINRMQLLPFEIDAYANGSFLITCILNGTTSNTAEIWQNVGGSSLTQYIFHPVGTTVTGGEPVFGFYLNSAQGTYATTQQDVTQLLSLGNSILGGGTANAAVGVYPNGPDVLTFVAQNIDTTGRAIQARFSWNEAQA
jgi:hypothetical protein